MNTIQKIWQRIYTNWLLVTIGLVILAHFCFGATWSWLWLPAGMMGVTSAAMHFRDEFFVPFRIILWPVIKFNLIKKLRVKDENIFNYPMIIWVECEARAPFIRGGWYELQAAMASHLDETADTLKSGLAKLARAEAMSED